MKSPGGSAWARAGRLLSVVLIALSMQGASGITPALAVASKATATPTPPTPVATPPNPNQQPSGATTPALRPGREVFGFAAAANLADPTFGYTSWNFNLLSTVAFFAIHVQYNGILVADSTWNVWDSSALTGLVSTAHAYGAKVVVTIVGPHNVIDQCDSLYNAQTTVGQIVSQVVLKGVDGVNIDYEGQLALCHNNNPALNQTNQSLLTNLARLMRAGLDAARPGYYLSIDTYSGSAAGNDGYFNIPGLNQYVDSFFVMAYDMDWANQSFSPLGCSAGHLGLRCLSPVSPLTTYYYNDTLSMAEYSAVAGPGKTILGQPYYGRVACVASPVAHGVPTAYLTAATYLQAIAVSRSPDVQPGTFRSHRDATDPNGVDRWDTWYDLKLHCWREMYWPDAPQLGARYNMVNQANLRGVGFWTLDYGGSSPELWSMLQAYFVSCASAGVTGMPSSPELSGTSIQLTATSTNCNYPLYEFWILAPGSRWTLARAYSSSGNLTWNTAGKRPGSYLFSVWARAALTRGRLGAYPNSYDATTILNYVLTTAPCTSVSASTLPASPATVGQQVTITPTASICPNPHYEFWLRAPGRPWALARGYSSLPTFTWSTIGKTPGSYLFAVWARDNSSLGTSGTSPNTLDSVGSFQYTLTWPVCTAMTETEVPPATSDVGTLVSITGNATGCPSPQYEFWLQPPGGKWTLVRPYSTQSFGWPAIGKAGVYNFSVWGRDANGPGTRGTRPNTYDVFTSFQHTLTTTPCTGVIPSSAPGSPSTAGTLVTISGSASICPNALYEFWMRSPSGRWTLAQGYSRSGTLNWTTTGAAPGSYLFSIWARDVSSAGTSGTAPNTYDAFATLPYTLS